MKFVPTSVDTIFDCNFKIIDIKKIFHNPIVEFNDFFFIIFGSIEKYFSRVVNLD